LISYQLQYFPNLSHNNLLTKAKNCAMIIGENKSIQKIIQNF